jgi:O-acetylhomoserine (thiol)-lyase
MSQDYRFDTLKVRGAYTPREHQFATSVPIYQTTAYELGDTERATRLIHAEEVGNLYTRIGNPTVAVLEQRVAALDGGAAGIALASGMAAVTYALLNIADYGERILVSPYLYGGTVDAFKKVFPRLGIGVDYASAEEFDDPVALEALIKPNTKAIFVESISNPLGIVADIEALATIAHKHDIPLVVDNTFATPYLIRPIEHGADVVVYSATKGISGHGNVIAGIVVESGKFDWGNGKFPQFTEKHYTLRDRSDNERSFLEVFKPFPFTTRIRMVLLNFIGAALGPFDAYLAILGLETLSERIEKQLANTRLVVDYLERSPYVEWVNWSSLPSSPNYAVAQKYAPKGSGSVIAFGFKGTPEQYDAFIDATKLFSYLANVADAKSLIINTPKTTHGELTPQEQDFARIAPNLIRLSIGLEDARDLIADLEQAFEAVLGEHGPDASTVSTTVNTVVEKGEAA